MVRERDAVRGIDDLDDARVVVVAAQACVAIALDERRVRRRPVDSRVGVAEQVEQRAAERVAAPVASAHARATLVPEGRQPRADPRRSPRAGSSRAAGHGDRDRAAHDLVGGREQARVVAEAPDAVALPRERPGRHHLVGRERLRPRGAPRRPRARARRPPTAGAGCRARTATVRLRSAAAVGDRQQQADGGEVRDQRRAPVAEERRDDAGQRDEAEEAAGNQQHGHDEAEREAGGEQRRVLPARARRDRKPSRTPAANSRAIAQKPGEPEFLASRREYEVGVRRRNDLGHAVSEAGAGPAAGRERPQRLCDLVAAARAVVPRRPPDLDARRERRGDPQDSVRGRTRRRAARGRPPRRPSGRARRRTCRGTRTRPSGPGRGPSAGRTRTSTTTMPAEHRQRFLPARHVQRHAHRPCATASRSSRSTSHRRAK